MPFGLTSRRDEGFTIVECMVAATLVVLGLLSMLTLLQIGNAETVTAQNRQSALNFSREVLEAARRAPYSGLAAASAEAQLQTTSGVGGGTPWTAVSRGTTFSLSATSCAIDDPSDGVGAHSTDFCIENPAAGTADQDPADMRRVGVTVSWTERGKTRSLRQGTLVRSPGEVDGPRVTSVSKTGNQPAVLTIQATAGTTRVVLYANGDMIGEATQNGSSWTYSWTVPAKNVQYYVDARAYDASGRSNPHVFRILVVQT